MARSPALSKHYMKLFVANIERKVTEAELKNLFSACGEVASVKIITDRATGSPKGFGFIEMPNDAEAQRAIDSINEKELGGRPLAVAQAKPKSSLH
jgi:RNA recognition motif-containing protein